MIEFKKCFVVNGTAYATVEEAREAIIGHYINNSPIASMTPDGVAQWIVRHGPELVDALTTNETSRPRCRKVNGGTKKRKAGVVVPTATQESKP